MYYLLHIAEYSNVLDKWIDAIRQTTIRSVIFIKV